MLYDLKSITLHVTRDKLKTTSTPEFQPGNFLLFMSMIVHTSVFSKNIVNYAPIRGLHTYGVRNDSHVRANEVTKINHDLLPEQIRHASNVSVALWNSMFYQPKGSGLYLFYFADDKTALSSSKFFSCLDYTTNDEPSVQVQCEICMFVYKKDSSWVIMTAIYEDEFGVNNV